MQKFLETKVSKPLLPAIHSWPSEQVQVHSPVDFSRYDTVLYLHFLLLMIFLNNIFSFPACFIGIARYIHIIDKYVLIHCWLPVTLLVTRRLLIVKFSRSQNSDAAFRPCSVGTPSPCAVQGSTVIAFRPALSQREFPAAPRNILGKKI